MFEIGSSLREARLRQGLALAQVEAQLRIRCRYLAALEEERFELLPGTAYARAFLRGYAHFLGLDSELFLSEYKARFEPAEELEEVRLPAVRTIWRLPIRPRLAAAAVILLLTVAGGLILGLAPGSHPHRSAAPVPRPPAAAIHAPTLPAPRQAKPARSLLPVRLRGIGAWDPYGDRHEHDSDAPAATDGNPSTYWETETYTAGLRKPGVGLLLDAGQPVRLRRLTLATDTPGYTALIQAGPAASGPFHAISPAITVAATTTFPLHAPAERYYLVWITKLDHVAHVNDVHAFR
ncbi:MAG: helix-turn-helix domain-containing protein [Gaiellaceae bacterium]|jgi:transcriptional regulator with XRE-family HTH domain